MDEITVYELIEPIERPADVSDMANYMDINFETVRRTMVASITRSVSSLLDPQHRLGHAPNDMLVPASNSRLTEYDTHGAALCSGSKRRSDPRTHSLTYNGYILLTQETHLLWIAKLAVLEPLGDNWVRPA